MPVDVRVGAKVVTVDMKNGQSSIALPDGATFTLDPHSKLLRRAVHIEEFQAYEKASSSRKRTVVRNNFVNLKTVVPAKAGIQFRRGSHGIGSPLSRGRRENLYY